MTFRATSVLLPPPIVFNRFQSWFQCCVMKEDRPVESRAFVLLVRPLKERCRPWKPWLRPSSTSSLGWPQSCLWTCPSSSPSCLSLTSWASQLPWWSTTACELPTHWAAVFSCLQPAWLGKPRSNKRTLHSCSSPRLTAIRDHSLEMKLLQKKAFVKRLLQSNSVGDVSHWPPYFLTSILPLLPCLPVSHFQQLTSKQVRPSCKSLQHK